LKSHNKNELQLDIRDLMPEEHYFVSIKLSKESNF